jgi:ABC-type transport system substrate-binding protein
VVSQYQFRIHLSIIHTLLLDEFMDSYLRVYCKKYVETVGKEEAFDHPIGTGPWKWVETVAGDHIKFEANEDSWYKVPEFKYLTLKLVPDASTAVFMLQSGQVNMTLISPDKVPEIQAAGLNIIQIPERKPIEVFFGGQHLPDNKFYDPTVPWADHPDEAADSDWNQRALKVRKALSLAINPQAMIDNIMHGYATPYVMHDITMSHVWYKPEWKPIPYDLAQAKALLAEAGYPNGFDKTVQVIIPSTPLTSVNTRAVAESVANDLEALGIKIERRVMEQNLIDEEWMYGFDSAWKIRLGLAWVIIHPSSGWIWSRASWAPLDEVGQRTKWDEFCTRSQAAKTDAELKQITEEAYDWAYTTYESRGLFVAPYLVAVGPEIKGYSKNPLYYESQGQYHYAFEYLEHAD